MLFFKRILLVRIYRAKSRLSISKHPVMSIFCHIFHVSASYEVCHLVFFMIVAVFLFSSYRVESTGKSFSSKRISSILSRCLLWILSIIDYFDCIFALIALIKHNIIWVSNSFALKKTNNYVRFNSSKILHHMS